MKKFAVLLSAIFCTFSAYADTIAIIGTGSVAKALGPEFAAQGHSIVYGSRNPDSEKAKALVAATPGQASAALPATAVIDADIVVLAVPGELVETITSGLGDLSGKIIIDPTNPLAGDWESQLTLSVETSNAKIVQDAAPDAYVVKAFSTLNWKEMVDPEGPISILMAGDSDAAKRKVAELATAMDLKPIDLGGVESAHWIEGMALLYLNNRISDRPNFDYFLRTAE